MAQMPHKSSLHDFIESSLTLVIWIDFKFQIIVKKLKCRALMLTQLSPYATLSLPNCHDFSLAYTVIASIFFSLAVAKVQTQKEGIFGWK